jgi:hypothetical protein
MTYPAFLTLIGIACVIFVAYLVVLVIEWERRK